MSRARDLADGNFSGDLEADSPTFVVDSANNRVGIGTTSPAVKLTSQIASSGVSGIAATATALFENSGNSDVVIAAGSASKSRIAFADSGDWIIGRIDYDHSDNSMRFGTFGTGEHMRIDSSGNVLIGTTVAASGTTGGASFVVESDNRRVLRLASTTTGGATIVGFLNPNGVVGTISTSGSATAYNTSSDYRLKEDVQPMVGASDRLMALKPVNFAWKADGSRVDGFLAHEAQEIVPEAVHGEKDAVDADGNPEYQGIDQSKLVPLLTAALQEALQKIDALEARVATLEGGA